MGFPLPELLVINITFALNNILCNTFKDENTLIKQQQQNGTEHFYHLCSLQCTVILLLQVYGILGVSSNLIKSTETSRSVV